MKSLKVVGTKVTRTSDFVLLEVEKNGGDSIELIEKILKNIDSGNNTRFSVRIKDNCKKCFVILLASERIGNNSTVREILKETNFTLLLP